MRAADSLDGIHDHISVDDPEAVDRTVSRIVEMCEGLSENPLRFRADERLGPDFRRFPVGPYIVFIAFLAIMFESLMSFTASAT